MKALTKALIQASLVEIFGGSILEVSFPKSFG
jgi:hypothetical protein